MAWIGIADSGLAYTFTDYASGVVMAGSVVSAANISEALFQVDFDVAQSPDVSVRITVQSYSATGLEVVVSDATFTFNGSGGPTQQVNSAAAANPQTAFTPAEFTHGVSTGFQYDGLVSSSSEFTSAESFSYLVEVEVEVPDPVSYNCECDDDYPRKTLLQMRTYLLTRLGYAAQLAAPPPGMTELLNSFLVDAQEQVYRQYKVFRMERYFTWDMMNGVRFYDLLENRDVCTKKLDPRKLTWVGISTGDDFWRPLVCGIKPEYYYSDVTGFPAYYEIRQCIEVWPPPEGDEVYRLRIKGYFGLSPLVADTDESSIDYEAIQLYALANAKAHYGQPDASNYMQQYRAYVSAVTAGSHHTRRYVPQRDEWVTPSLPVFTGYSGD